MPTGAGDHSQLLSVLSEKGLIADDGPVSLLFKTGCLPPLFLAEEPREQAEAQRNAQAWLGAEAAVHPPQTAVAAKGHPQVADHHPNSIKVPPPGFYKSMIPSGPQLRGRSRARSRTQGTKQ